MLRNRRLSVYDKIVLAAMSCASYKANGKLSMSHSAIGELCCISRTQVLDSIRNLNAAGLVASIGDPVKQIQGLQLQHDRHNGTLRNEIVHCAECSKPCRRLNKAGHCRTCATRLDRERQWTAARAVLGSAASIEQVALHLHIGRITKPWLATARAVDQRRAA